jgi:ubiquinone/menaquinone biosynthesis C-methylase UbiE
MTAGMSQMKSLHTQFISGRRIRLLAKMLGAQLPKGATILDVGCGDGSIAQLLLQQDSTLTILGLEVSARPKCVIEYQLFDGRHIPHPDDSFDVCMFVDVLHHAEDSEAVLKEGSRVSRRFVLIKDHLSENQFDWWTLKLMDWLGNRPYGVALTYGYKSRSEWDRMFEACGLRQRTWQGKVPLHSFPLRLLFSRGLHYVALLEKTSTP